MTYFIILSTLLCLMGNASSQLVDSCRRGFTNSKDCLEKLALYKKAFFTDRNGNIKDKISFSDFLNHYKSAGYEFPKEAIEAEAEKFYRYANGGEWESICWGCGNGDGHMDLREMVMSKVNYNRPT